MTRKSKRSSRLPTSQMKSVNADVKAIKKRSQELLRKAGRDIRAVRHEVSQLKKAGIVSSRIDVRSYQPSRYMLSKLAANRDILSGESVAVRAPKKVRQKYVEKGLYEERGSVLVVPKDYANQRTRISRGMVEITRELANGEERRIVLPFKPTDMEQVAEWLKTDPSLDGVKEPDEMFGFRLFGHSMQTFGFPDAESLGQYITERYAHLFSGKNGREGVKHFVLFRFKSADSVMREGPEALKLYGKRNRQRRPGDDWLSDQRRDRDVLRKRKARASETPEERQKRVDEQRERSRRNRNEKAARKIERLSGLD